MKIYYSKKETRNLGNYENVTIEIKAEDDVDHEVETIDQAFARLQSFVKGKLSEQEFGLEKKVVTSEVKSFTDNVKNIMEIKKLSIVDVKKVLDKFDVKKLSELREDKYQQFIDYLTIY